MIPRPAFWLAIVALTAFRPATALSEPAEASHAAAATDGLAEYTVKCRVLDKRHPFTWPTMRVRDGQTASVADTTETAIVVAEKVVDGQKTPVARIIKEGTTVDVTVIKVDEKSVVLDFSLQLQSTNGSLKTFRSGQEKGIVYSLNRRLVEQVSLGKATTATIGDLKLEVVVAAAD
jgi:hypothetical protein